MKRFILLIPFFYFQQTRLNQLKYVGFQFAYEWVPGYMLLAREYQFSWLLAGKNYLLNYLAFLCLYEIGYYFNDWMALKTNSGRKRTAAHYFTWGVICIFVGFRIAAFLVIGFYLNQLDNVIWWAWYLTLSTIFVIHSLLCFPMLQIVTFVNLAFMRFFSPLLFNLTPASFMILFPGVMLNYVFFRTITYMDNKNLLVFSTRKSHTFRTSYYALLLGISTMMAMISHSFIPLSINFYYLSVAFSFAFLGRILPDEQNAWTTLTPTSSLATQSSSDKTTTGLNDE